jgi:hypothetical protein
MPLRGCEFQTAPGKEFTTRFSGVTPQAEQYYAYRLRRCHFPFDETMLLRLIAASLPLPQHLLGSYISFPLG